MVPFLLSLALTFSLSSTYSDNMRLPTLFSRSDRPQRSLEKRKGGGHGGGRSGGTNSGGHGNGGRAPVTLGRVVGSKGTARPYGRGGGKVTTIPDGQPFAGRTQGGGSRLDIYGTK